MRPKTLLLLLAGASVLSLGGAAAAQSTCGRDDIACRLDRIEARLTEIERRLGGSGSAPSSSAGVSMATFTYCGSSVSSCQSAATSVCRSAGFNRGVPAEHERRDYEYFLTRATCLD